MSSQQNPTKPLGYRCAYETGAFIQDASFHGQLRLPRELLTDEYIVQLQASNFGHLATIYDDDTVVKQDARATIVSTLAEFGYIYQGLALRLAVAHLE